MSDLTPKQERFCQEYKIDLNGTQAAIRAGYSKKTANEQAAQLLAKLSIQNRIKELQQEIAERNKLKADDVIEELRKIGFMTIDELFTDNGTLKEPWELSEKAKAAVSSIKVTRKSCKDKDDEDLDETVEVKLWDKGKALIALGNHLGIFDKKDNSNTSLPAVIGINNLNDKKI